MTKNNLIPKLLARGMIAKITDEKALTQHLDSGPIALYCGLDPTAESLHLGHLIPLLCLKHFQLAGHLPIVLIGGATGLIGDPSFKATERKLNTAKTVQEWTRKIKYQLLPFLNFSFSENRAIIVNNYDWFGSMNVLAFLRDIGKHFSINQMISKEAVKQRLLRNNEGISFTEFSYNLLQGYDFAYLYQKHNVILQIGGSDQWGNITSGIDLTRRIHQHTVYGLTVPLITSSNGTKFGKTESNTVWLDPSKTSPYKFYQFWINIADKDVYRFLKLFTFLDIDVINTIEQEDLIRDKAPQAQYILAEEVTRMVHGEDGLSAAKRITASIFSTKLSNLTESDFAQLAQDGISTVDLVDSSIDLQQAMIASKLARSRGQARILINASAVSVNGKKQTTTNYVFSNSDKLYGKYTLLSCGKKNYCLLHW